MGRRGPRYRVPLAVLWAAVLSWAILAFADEPQLERYPATVARVIEGDTFEFVAWAGFGISYMDTGRLAGIDTWEVRGANREKGRAATEFVRDWVSSCAPLTLTVPAPPARQRGKYGRWLVDLESPTCPRLSSALRAHGHEKVRR